MSDKTIFDTQNNQPASVPPQQGDATRITTQDLYGPSGNNSNEIFNPPQNSNLQTENTQPDLQQTEGNVNPVMTPVSDDVSVQTDNPQPGAMRQNLFAAFSGNKKMLIAGAIVLFIILLIFIGIISRIRGGKNGGGTGNATLTYWGLWEENNTMETIIKDFEKKNPGIKIIYEKQDPEKYKERLVTRIENNTQAPDIFTFHNTWVSTLTNSADNVLLPLSKDVVNTDDFQKNYYVVVQKDLSKKGAVYGMPQGIDTLSLFINKEIFDAAGVRPPATWEEFNSLAKSLTVRTGEGRIETAGAALGTYDNITHAPDIISLLFFTNGIDLSNIDNQKDLLKQAIKYYTEFSTSSEAVWNSTLSSSRDMFAAGKLAMYFGYSWDIFQINAKNKDLKFETYPVPYLPSEGSGQNRVTVASYWANGVSVKSKHQKESMLFLKYLSQKDTMQKIYSEASKSRSFGMPYPRKDIAKSLSTNPLVYPFVNQAEYAVSSYFASDTHDSLYNGPLNEYLGNAIRQIISSGGSVDSATDTFLKGVKQVRSQSLK